MRVKPQTFGLLIINNMLTQDEKDALLELKSQGYTFSDAMGFIASSRMGNVSKVERELSQEESPQVERSDARTDLSRGFTEAKQAVTEGFERQDAVEQRPTLAGRVSGTLGTGFRAAGEAIGSLTSGAIRAIPGGTTVMNKLSDVTSDVAEKAVSSDLYKGVEGGFNKLPQGVQQTFGDVGNVAMGALGIAEPLVVPGGTKALSQGIKAFAETGIKEVGEKGIQTTLKTGLEPESIMQRVARISKGKQTNFEQRAGESVGTYLVRRGIYGDPENITEQLYQRMQASKNRVDSGLSRVGGVYKNDTVSDALEQLAEREARVSSLRTSSPDTDRVDELYAKHNKEGLTLTEVNEVKRLYERNIKLDYLRDNVSDGIAKANNIDNQLRDFVERTAADGGFPTVKALNKETYLAKQLLDDLGAEYAGQQGNNFVSLSDAFFLAEAASNPTALAAFGLKKAISSKGAMSAVAKLMARNRKVQDLPSGDTIEPKLLPAPNPGSPRSAVYSNSVIPAGGQTPDGVVNVGITERALPGAVRTPGGEAKPSIIKEIQDIETDALEQMRASIEMSEVTTSVTQDGRYLRNSSFPNWLPDDKELRSKELMTKVLKHIEDGTIPKEDFASNQFRLYEAMKQHLERVKFDKLNAQTQTGFTADDIPFAIVLTTGALGAYYTMGEDGSLVALPVIGFMAATPGGRKMMADELKVSIKKMEKIANATKDKPTLNRLQKGIESAKLEIQKLES